MNNNQASAQGFRLFGMLISDVLYSAAGRMRSALRAAHVFTDTALPRMHGLLEGYCRHASIAVQGSLHAHYPIVAINIEGMRICVAARRRTRRPVVSPRN